MESTDSEFESADEGDDTITVTTSLPPPTSVSKETESKGPDRTEAFGKLESLSHEIASVETSNTVKETTTVKSENVKTENEDKDLFSRSTNPEKFESHSHEKVCVETSNSSEEERNTIQTTKQVTVVSRENLLTNNRATITLTKPPSELNESPRVEHITYGEEETDLSISTLQIHDENNISESDNDTRDADICSKLSESKNLVEDEDGPVRKTNTFVSKADQTDAFSQGDSMNIHQMEKPGQAVLDNLAKVAEQQVEQSSWGWSSWGSSLLSTASSSVSTFTSQIVDAAIGAPDPEVLAMQDKIIGQMEADEKKSEEQPRETNESEPKPSEVFHEDRKLGFGGLFSGVTTFTKSFEIASNAVVSTGINTLELIGKTTMEVLQEGDPGLKKKIGLFKPNKPNLSEVLKEAKYKAEQDWQQGEGDEKLPVAYATYFDKGLVHLEALEMLSKQSETRVQTILLSYSGEQLRAKKSVIDKIRADCAIEEVDMSTDDEAEDFDILLSHCVNALNLNLKSDKLIDCQSESRQWIWDCECDQEKGTSRDTKDIHEEAIKWLAEMTTLTVELLHKCSEMLLVSPPSTLDSTVSNLVAVTKTCCVEISAVSELYCKCLNASRDGTDADTVNSLTTSIFLEASNSNTYIQDALELVVPVLQRLFLDTKQR